MKVLLLSILASLAVSFALAEQRQCNLKLSRSSDGTATRIEVDNSVTLIDTSSNLNWNSYNINGNQVTQNNMSGTLSKSSRSELPGDAQSRLQQLESMSMNGTRISFQSGKLLVESTNGENYCTKSNENNTFTMANGKSREFLALNLVSTSNFTNVLVQNGSIVSLVDNNCQVTTTPMNKLGQDLQELLKKTIQDPRGQRFGPDSFRSLGPGVGPGFGPGIGLGFGPGGGPGIGPIRLDQRGFGPIFYPPPPPPPHHFGPHGPPPPHHFGPHGPPPPNSRDFDSMGSAEPRGQNRN